MTPYEFAINVGLELGWVTAPASVRRMISTDKAITGFRPYRHLKGTEFDLAEFRRAWAKHHDAPGLFLLNSDLIEIEDTDDGDAALQALRMPRTVTFRSKRGRKWLYRKPAETFPTGVGVLGPGTEVIATDQFIIPPTGGYFWLGACSPFEIDVAPVPERILAAMGKKPRRRSRGKSGPTKEIPDVIENGDRHNALVSIAGQHRRLGAPAESLLEVLREANATKCAVPVEDRELEGIAKSVAEYEPDPNAWPDDASHLLPPDPAALLAAVQQVANR